MSFGKKDWTLDKRIADMPDLYLVQEKFQVAVGKYTEVLIGPTGEEAGSGSGTLSIHTTAHLCSEAFRRGYHAAIRDAPRGAADIVSERIRQVEEEEYSDSRDDRYGNFELLLAAESYIKSARGAPTDIIVLQTWPWRPAFFKPSHPTRDLAKAGALIAAEIDRIRRYDHRTRRNDPVSAIPSGLDPNR